MDGPYTDLGLAGVGWVVSPEIRSSSLLFFVAEAVKSISLSSAYGTLLTAEGISHLQGTEVQVLALIILTPASTANSTAPTCEQTSPSPAMQLQCPVRTFHLF